MRKQKMPKTNDISEQDLIKLFNLLDKHPLKAETVIMHREDALEMEIPVTGEAVVVIKKADEDSARPLTPDESQLYFGNLEEE